jgi:hypothetical protein
VHGITGHNFETRHPSDDSDQVRLNPPTEKNNKALGKLTIQYTHYKYYIHYTQYQVNAILLVYVIVGLCWLDIEMFSYIF